MNLTDSSRKRLMILANERLKNAPVKKSQSHIDFHEEDFKNAPSSEDELLKRLGHRWKYNLSRLGSVIEVYKHITANYLKDSTKFPTILSIACTNKTLLGIFGNKMNVSEAIRLGRRVCLVQCVSEKYRFGNFRWRFSKQYAWNKSIEKTILNLIKVHNISVRVHEKDLDDVDVDEIDVTSHDPSENSQKIKVSSKLKGVSTANNDARSALGHRYNWSAKETKGWSDFMNRFLLPPEQRIKYDYNLHYSPKGYLTKVGIRATSMICSTKVHRDGNKNYTGVYRDEYLDSQFGKGNWDEFDVNGSIYQVAHLISTGEWLGNNVDPYEIMFGKFESKENRKAIKRLFMCLYFDYKNSILHHNRKRIPVSLKMFGKDVLQKDIDAMIEEMERFTGKSLDNLVFMHESNIFIRFLYRLRVNMGLKIVQVYDCFYFEKGTITKYMLDEILKDCAMEYYNKIKDLPEEQWK